MKMWNRLSAAKKELFLLLVMAGFGLAKQFLVYNLPIMAVPKGIHDDWIMVHLADTLRSGQWLGEYNSLTLTKGMFFPLYLAVINFLHLSYLNVTALLYTVGCMVFVYALRPLVPKQLPRLILYLALLWNPISYSLQAFQRVYRNSISYIQVLLKIIGITYISEFAAEICHDAGYSAIASQIGIFAKLSILAVSMPIVTALLDTIQGFLGG